MTHLTTEAAEDGKKPTLSMIESDLNTGDWDALYFATEKQIASLIDSDKIDEDFFSRHQEYQEEMRVMIAECV